MPKAALGPEPPLRGTTRKLPLTRCTLLLKIPLSGYCKL